jgi:hypothetical protein
MAPARKIICWAEGPQRASVSSGDSPATDAYVTDPDQRSRKVYPEDEGRDRDSSWC